MTMGRQFGHLTRVRHVITYSLSPFEQRAFPHYFSKGIPNVLRRTRACILRVAPRECPGRAERLDSHPQRVLRVPSVSTLQLAINTLSLSVVLNAVELVMSSASYR